MMAAMVGGVLGEVPAVVVYLLTALIGIVLGMVGFCRFRDEAHPRDITEKTTSRHWRWPISVPVR